MIGKANIWTNMKGIVGTGVVLEKDVLHVGICTAIQMGLMKKMIHLGNVSCKVKNESTNCSPCTTSMVSWDEVEVEHFGKRDMGCFCERFVERKENGYNKESLMRKKRELSKVELEDNMARNILAVEALLEM